MPVLLVLLTVIFASLAAPRLALAIGGNAIIGSFTALRLAPEGGRSQAGTGWTAAACLIVAG